MAGKVKELTDSTFGSVVGTGVTLVDFWAPWCGPCQMQGPIVEKLAEEFDGKAVVAKLNVDEQPQTASQFGVNSIPTLVVMKDGKEVKRLVGLNQQKALAEVLNGAL